MTVAGVAGLPPETEAAFQRRVVALLELTGWLVFHVHDSRRSPAGFPDLVALHRRHGLVFAELKSERGAVRVAQRRWLDALREGGQRAYLWRPADWPEIERVARGGR